MPLKTYFQDQPPGPHDRDRLKIGVIAWHLGWSGFTFACLLCLLILPASPLALGAMLVIALPGVCATVLLTRDGVMLRQALVWVWAVAAFLAVAMTGGIAGPLAAWIAVPVVAAVAMNQRVLIQTGVTASFALTLFESLISVSDRVRTPDGAEAFWLSLIAVFSVVIGLGLSLLPALRVRVERAADAEDARARLLKMLTEQPQLILSLDESGRVVSAYGEVPGGLDLTSLMSHGLSASAHAPDRVPVAAAIEAALAQGRAEVGFVPHAALERYIHLSLRRGEDGKLYGALSDGSLTHAREAALEAARAEADHQNQSKTRFLASMSHELRTPLNAVIGFSDIMRQQLFGPLSAKYTEYAQLIWESGQHVLDMINDVLDVSKIEAQKYELSLESFDIRDPVSQALRLLRAQAHDKAIDIMTHLPPQALSVTADKRAIKQIALNLLSNAIKFTPRGGTVSLTLNAGEDGVAITVTDTGIGIAPDDLSRIGKPFEQSGPADQRAMGTGLGLSIVQAMARLHGGTMKLQSTLGVGTTVTVTLPVAQAAEDLTPELPFAAPEPASDPVTLNPLLDRSALTPGISNHDDFVIRQPKG